MDGITVIDSLIAFNRANNKPLQLPMRDIINVGFGDRSLLVMGGFVMIDDPAIAYTYLLSDKTTNDELDFHISG